MFKLPAYLLEFVLLLAAERLDGPFGSDSNMIPTTVGCKKDKVCLPEVCGRAY